MKFHRHFPARFLYLRISSETSQRCVARMEFTAVKMDWGLRVFLQFISSLLKLAKKVMALLAQQALPIAALLTSTCSSVGLDSGSLDETPSCSTFLPSASSFTTTSGLTYSIRNAALFPSYRLRAIIKRQPGRSDCSGGNCRDSFRHRVLPLFSHFQGLPLLHLSGGLRVSGQDPQRRRARRGDRSESSKEADEEDTEPLQELIQEVEEAQRSQDYESDLTDEQQDADRQESPGESGKGSGEDDVEDNETVVQSEEEKTGSWRKIWEPAETEEDVALDYVEELLVQELESWSFNWKTLLDPSWDNVIPLRLTALLTIALFKILFQLVLVVITILVSGLKYFVLAAFVLGFLIFLL